MRAPYRVLCSALLTLAIPVDAARADEPAAAASWATTQAAELTRQARDHAARGDRSAAQVRFVEAIKLDPTYGPAYLGLAAEYEASGDAREAERTYAVGLDHVPGFAEALMARARLRSRLHRPEEAAADLEAASAIDPDALPLLRELAAAYIAARALPAALSVMRRAATLAEAQHDAAAAARARTEVKALALLVGEADPVTAGRAGRGAVRHALWWVARRR